MTRDEQRAEHNRLYTEASAIVFPLIKVHGKPVTKLTGAQQANLRRGIAMFESVLEINPQNWSAMWLVGKGHQRLRDFAQAFAWFSRAHTVNPSHPDISREAAIAAMELGRPAEAIPFCVRAIESRPDDPGLRANLALATLFSGKPADAVSLAKEALRQDPADRITRRIVEICNEVLAGKRLCPTHAREIK